MWRTNLKQARFTCANLQEANLIDANLQSANLERAKLQKARLGNANLRDALLNQACFKKANLSEANLQNAQLVEANFEEAKISSTDLRNALLVEANLQKAILKGADLQEAILGEADLQSSDLSGSNLDYSTLSQAKLKYTNLQNARLENVGGLIAGQLTGANVSGAKLPEDIKKFEGLTQVEKISQRAQKLFLSILLGCVYCWLTIATTTDVGLLTNSSSSPLPIIQTKIPIASFYLIAPLILLSLYFWFHLYLQRLWEWLAKLPAVFPDGERLDAKVYPWLVSGLASSHVTTLIGDRLPLSRLQTGISIFLAWRLVPLTFIVFWLRYLPKHEWRGTIEHVALIVITCGFAAWSYALARKTLRGQRKQAIDFKNGWKTWGFYKSLLSRGLNLILAGMGLLVFTAIVYAISDGAIKGMVPKESEWAFTCSGGKAKDSKKERDDTILSGWTWAIKEAAAPLIFSVEERWVGLIKANGEANPTFKSTLRSLRSRYRKVIPMILPCVGGRAFADLKEQEVSMRPANWFAMRDYDAEKTVDVVSGANLRGSDLRGASAEDAFLMKADLRNADLREAILTRANLEKGQLEEVKMQGANLMSANLKEANLRTAQLQKASLLDANLQEANLVNANLQEADLILTNFQGARLFGANMHQANLGNANLQEADLGGANLDGANLTNANLLNVENLTKHQLAKACSHGDTKLNPGFEAPRACAFGPVKSTNTPSESQGE